MNKNIFKILRGTGSIINQGNEIIKKTCNEYLELNLIKGNYVTREEFNQLRNSFLKLKNDFEVLKNSHDIKKPDKTQ
ncbi:hypothetical protein [Rickettsia endosymbiont of Cardiosporidium cionae]|uniref:hypothetical protein n=1 Tax=Rickettsia endosymbiont of Cardiosporidium cionae TaxID=2777155 RepID=UPI0018952FEC|nr:hypothetical protein [Rickettsia endosymbiont of Cardiosporidium cionae]KAF8818976.1 hypothetical protein IHI24_000211 [Rickettsia endosymbiont of Cardiosporidium cionae]